MAIPDDYTLCNIVQIVTTYDTPGGEFVPEGTWENVYARYSLNGTSIQHESDVSLSRESNGDGTAKLRVLSSHETLSGYRFIVEDEMIVDTNAVSSPRTWTRVSKLARNPEELACAHSELSTSVTFGNGQCLVTENGTRRTISLSGPVSQRWALIDAIQRLDASLTGLPDFTWFDEMPQCYPGHRLTLRGVVNVEMNGEFHQLTGWQQTGSGIAPTVFWRDEQGRLLFVLMGVEAWVLRRCNGVDIAYQNDPSFYQETRSLVGKDNR